MRLAWPGLAQYYIDRHRTDTANSLADRLPFLAGKRRGTALVHQRFICIMASCHNGQYDLFSGTADIREPLYDRTG